MKGIGVMVLLVMVSVCSMSAQTVEIEKEIVNQKLRDGSLSPKNLKRLGEAWKNLLNNHGGYLELPYDTIEKKVKYEFIEKVPGAKKESIIDGILEWVTLNYGSLHNTVVFEDARSGRLIIKGHYISDDEPFTRRVNGVLTAYGAQKCTFNITFTVKQGIFKSEYGDISFARDISKYSEDGIAVASGDKKYTLESSFPITKRDYKYWGGRMWSIKNTDKQIKKQQKKLHKYLIERKDSFDF